MNLNMKRVFELTFTKALYMGKGAILSMASGALLVESSQAAIVAKAGGGQANATQLFNEVNEVGTVATAGDSVKLPTAVAGLTVYVVNKGANPMQVYGLASDTIDDVAAATGVSQMVNSIVLYTATTTGKWRTEGLATGYSGSLQTLSNKTGIVAHAGGTQAGAIGDANSQISAMINNITTCATGGDSVVLPTAVPGMQLFIANAGAASCNVFPFTGDQINGAGANAAFALAAGKTATLVCTATLNWRAVLSA